MIGETVKLGAYGQGPTRVERRELVAQTAQRNFMCEEMRLNVLAEYEQGIKRQFLGYTSLLQRWRRRLRRRYRWLKSVRTKEKRDE